MRRFIPAVLWLTLGCVGQDASLREPVVRDSAGIRVVEYADLPQASAPTWQVASTPRLSLGGAGAEEAHQFFMVTTARVLSDGRLVVANAGSQELRWYDAAGTWLHTAGRRGDGPEEFRMLAGFAVGAGDTVVTYDGDLRRFSVFGPQGAFVRTALVEREGHAGMDYPVLAGMMADGSLLMTGRAFDVTALRPGPLRASMPVFRYARDGAVLDSLGAFPGWEAQVIQRESGDVLAMSISGRPFGRTTSVVPVPDGFVAGTPNTYQFERYGADGTLRTVVRVNRPNLPITDADVASFEAGQLEEIESENERRQRREELAALEYPDTRPAYGFPLIADRAGNVWVRELRPPGDVDDDAPVRWTVFDPDGRYLASAETPAGLGIMEIGDDYLLGVWRDELDVEHVRMYDVRGREGQEGR